MKKIILIIAIVTSSLFAKVINEYPSQKIVNSNTPIVDIRTPGEWKATGLLKGAIPIMFFNARGGYNVNAFLKKLNKEVNTKKPFALICHSGSRTSMVSAFLSKELGYTVINLKGGMDYATKGVHLRTLPYKK